MPNAWGRRLLSATSTSSTVTTSIWSPRVVFGGDQEEYDVRRGTVEIDPTTGTIRKCFPGESKEEARNRVERDNNNNNRSTQFVDLSEQYSAFSSLCLSPGLIDVHTHISALGRNWEGYTTATQAAAAGGITTIIGMPLNSLPPTISADIVEQELRSAQESKLYVDVGLWGGVMPETATEDDQMRELLSHPNVLGLKAFLSPLPPNAGYQAISPEQLLHVAEICGSYDKPILVHSELMRQDDIDKALQSAYPDDGSLDDSYKAHVQSRPPQWEQDAVRVVIEATQYCDMHVVHLSDALGCLPLIQQAKASPLSRRYRLTVETCPHYLLLDTDQIQDGDTRVKCFPPIREPEQRAALWNGLKSGLIDMVASDHSPCEPAMRQKSMREAWGGLTGLQYQLVATWTPTKAMPNLKVTEADMAKWWSRNPARLARLDDRGSIEPGKKADLVVWETHYVDIPDCYSQEYHRWKGDCFYSSQKLSGNVVATWLGGAKIYDGLEDSHFSHRGTYIEHKI
jgi:allantoinase